jgi:hypothetical protein
MLAPRLAAMLPANCLTLTLLHKTEFNNLSPTCFWDKVRDKGNILVLVRNTAGFIFGGYVRDVYVHKGDPHWIAGNPSNFVFTLGSNHTPAVKLLKTDAIEEGVYMNEERAFMMGGGGDLCVESGNTRTNPGQFNIIAPGYPLVAIDANLLAGSPQWTPAMTELWKCGGFIHEEHDFDTHAPTDI